MIAFPNFVKTNHIQVIQGMSNGVLLQSCGISIGKILSLFRLFQITNLMHNSFILHQYVCYITILNMFRAVSCSSSGGTNCIITASVIVTGNR